MRGFWLGGVDGFAGLDFGNIGVFGSTDGSAVNRRSRTWTFVQEVVSSNPEWGFGLELLDLLIIDAVR